MSANTSILTFRRPARLFTRPEEEKAVSSNSAPPARALLQTFEELPPWYQDNPCVRTAYRPVSNSFLSCLHSWTYFHNETLNIYTHLLPCVFSLFLQLYTQYAISSYFPSITLTDRLVLALNIFAATITLLLSTFYHTLMNHSFLISSLWLRIDYVGILTLVLGSFLSGIHVGFYPAPHLRLPYYLMITSLALLTSLIVLHPKLQGMAFRALRTAAFVLTACSGFAPIAHGLSLYGWEHMWERSGMPFWLAEGVVYGIGAALFASRWPEKRAVGRWDFGGSHAAFHICVVAAAGVHLCGVWSAMKFWLAESGATMDV